MKRWLFSTCLWKLFSKGCSDGNRWTCRRMVAKIYAICLESVISKFLD